MLLKLLVITVAVRQEKIEHPAPMAWNRPEPILAVTEVNKLAPANTLENCPVDVAVIELKIEAPANILENAPVEVPVIPKNCTVEAVPIDCGKDKVVAAITAPLPPLTNIWPAVGIMLAVVMLINTSVLTVAPAQLTTLKGAANNISPEVTEPPGPPEGTCQEPSPLKNLVVEVVPVAKA